jgi:DNA-binding PadR family transcriptional regulator
MKDGPPARSDVLQGTLILLVLRTLEALGPLHGYGIARRIELSGSAAHGTGRLDYCEVGRLGEQS